MTPSAMTPSAMTPSAMTPSAMTPSALRSPQPAAVDGARECGSAVADFAMVAGLLSLLFLAVFQLGLALHIRNTLIACASEGARYGARADAGPRDGEVRTRQLIRASLSDRYAGNVTSETITVAGILVVRLHVEAPLPVIGPLGPDRLLSVDARAFSEKQ